MKIAANQAAVNKDRFNIRPMQKQDWPDVLRIYKEGLKSKNATFETAGPDWKNWDENHHKFGRLILEMNGAIVGWAALLPVSKRAVYYGVAEVSIYITNSVQGLGFGKLLLTDLIRVSEKNDIWTLQAVMFPENKSSVALHEKCGFIKVGERDKIAKHHGIWRNTLLFERRSKLI